MARLQREAEADRAERPQPAEIRAMVGRAMAMTEINVKVLDLIQKFHLIPIVPQDDDGDEMRCSCSSQQLLSPVFAQRRLRKKLVSRFHVKELALCQEL